MKTVAAILAVALLSVNAMASANLSDTPERPGVKTLTITGGAGSLAEGLFNQMSAAKEDSDAAMGGRLSINRYGPELECEKHLQNNQLVGYVCSVEISNDGSFLSTNQE